MRKRGKLSETPNREDFPLARGVHFRMLFQGWKIMRKRARESSCLPPVHWNSWAAGELLCIVLLLAVQAGAQAHGTPSLPTLPSGAPVGSREDYGIPSNDPLEEARRLRALNYAREKGMVSDAKKLLKLTTELNAEIAVANSGVLTPAQLQKLAKIEKLAHSVSEKMRAAAAFMPGNQSPPSP